ncbi:oligosaccharide flippase family protein [Lacinutrix sp. WUR7]|uniref:flippase n=1 Tax=Lacinutrix sp. WUR7 TaxID=2653681 RepID=UPI00193D12C7|nr:flippase [Lacinutrix sp. WUR7]QRM88725.1 oligosaccharide flippase family protein [Lacinutrix sp. WUR7]
MFKKIHNIVFKANKNEIIKKSFIVMFLKAIGILLGYTFTLLLTKRFGATGYGIYNITYSSIIVFGHFASFGLSTSILRFMGQYAKKEKEYERKRLYFHALKLILTASFVLSFLLYFFAEEIALNIFKDASYKEILKSVSFIAPFFTINLINVEYLRGLQKIKLSEIFRTILIPLICVLILLVFPKTTDIKIPIYALGFTIISIAFISITIILTKTSHIKKTVQKELKFSKLVKTSIPMMVITISSYFTGNLSIYIIQIVLSTFYVGIFSLCLKLSFFISFILIGVNTVLAPKLSELFWANKKQELSNIILTNSKFIFWLSFPVFLVIVLFSNQLLAFFGEEFTEGKYVLIVLALGQFINATCGSVGVLLNMTGNQKSLMHVTIIIGLTAIVLNIVLIQIYGLIGAAIATTVCLSLQNIILVIIAKKKLNINTLYLPFIS